MKTNYYAFINEKIKSMDLDIVKKKKEIQNLRKDGETLRKDLDNKIRIRQEREVQLESILSGYRKNGFKTIVAKKTHDVQSWKGIHIKACPSGGISVIDREGNILGKIVGDKVQKIKMLICKIPNYNVSITKVNEETFEMLISFNS